MSTILFAIWLKKTALSSTLLSLQAIDFAYHWSDLLTIFSFHLTIFQQFWGGVCELKNFLFHQRQCRQVFKEETSHIKVQFWLLFIFFKIPIKFNVAWYRSHRILIQQLGYKESLCADCHNLYISTRLSTNLTKQPLAWVKLDNTEFHTANNIIENSHLFKT